MLKWEILKSKIKKKTSKNVVKQSKEWNNLEITLKKAETVTHKIGNDHTIRKWFKKYIRPVTINMINQNNWW